MAVFSTSQAIKSMILELSRETTRCLRRLRLALGTPSSRDDTSCSRIISFATVLRIAPFRVVATVLKSICLVSVVGGIINRWGP